jgi:NADH-quinone oxidoreductase subunit M
METNLFTLNLLSIVTFLPLLGAVVLMLLPDTSEYSRAFKYGSLTVAILTFLVSLALLLPGPAAAEGLWLHELKLPWIEAIGATFHLALDGISLWLVLLNTLLFCLAILTSIGTVTKRIKLYFILLLLLETAVTGVFLAQDLLLFYVFFEATLIPMYFLIGIWGSKRRLYATTKFVLYTMAGSLLMLGAIIAIYLHAHSSTLFGQPGFSIFALSRVGLPESLQFWCFLAFFLAFAIKVPLFPLHTWLPDAHTEAPTAGSIILAGVLLKMGVYGFLRIAFPLCPNAPFMSIDASGVFEIRQLIMGLAVVGIIYGALVAAVQSDVKRLVAYSSVAHMGFIMLGLFSFNQTAVDGAILQMVNHGVSTGALFMLVGFIYERRHTRAIADFGGLASVMPVYFNFFLLIMLSSVGLPALNGFVGEFMILIGSFDDNPLLTVIATSGVILAAVYLLYMFRRVFFGEIRHEENRGLKDLNAQEIAGVLPLAVLAVVMGVFPAAFLKPINDSSSQLVEKMRAVSELMSAQESAEEGYLLGQRTVAVEDAR